jgi:hypothetical protein
VAVGVALLTKLALLVVQVVVLVGVVLVQELVVLALQAKAMMAVLRQ